MADAKKTTFHVGPFGRVRTTANPYDDQSPDTMEGATNFILADPLQGGALHQRPGSVAWGSLTNGGNEGQGVYCHTAEDGVHRNFVFINGKVYRQDTDLATQPVDVTPVGVTISASSRIYATSLGGQLVVNDGVNRPWLGTDLSATPITGAEIDYDGAGTAWVAFGRPVVYTGALFFILQSVNGASARTTIAWSEPNQPASGYQQTGFDNAWTLTQTGTGPLYALAPTNEALYYSRDLSWGAIVGAPGINFQSTATHDEVSGNVGCTNPGTVSYYLNYIYFADQIGRPWRFPVGGKPEPLWLQLQTTFADGGFPSVSSLNWGVIEPNLNVFLFGLAFGLNADPLLFVFDASTGIYMGSWTGFGAHVGGVLRDDDGTPQLTMIGTDTTGLGSSVLWKLARLQDGLWTDNASTMNLILKTGYLGYAISTRYTFPRARMVAGSSRTADPVTPVVGMVLRTTEVTGVTANGHTPGATPTTAQCRLTWMTDQAAGRGATLTFQPSTWSDQFRVYRIELDATAMSDGGIDDR